LLRVWPLRTALVCGRQVFVVIFLSNAKSLRP